jgi:hypothetical protein
MNWGVKFSGTHFLSLSTETDQLVQKLKENAHKRLSSAHVTTSPPLTRKLDYELISYFNFLYNEKS